jgi:sulfite exporter TauE/SafE
MLSSLALSAFLMGLAGTPHCLAMCAAPCTAVAGPRPSAAQLLVLHGGRCLSYGLGGMLVAASVGGLAQWSLASPALRPIWVAIHLVALGVGLAMALTGRQPDWLSALWHRVHAQGVALSGGASPVHWASRAGEKARPLLAPGQGRLALGLLWLAWPCGLLQSALLMATLADSAVGGLAIMVAFGLGTSMGLVAGPALMWRFLGLAGVNGSSSTHPWTSRAMTWATRLAGGVLVIGSGWALTHGLWAQVAALCM